MKVGEKSFRKYIWFGLIAFVLFTGFFGSQIRNVDFDYDFEKFFPVGDSETSFFFEHRNRFKSENDFLLIALEREKGIFDKSFLNDVANYTKKIEKIDNVTFVNSITNQEEYFLFSGGMTDSRPYINLEDFNAKRDSAGIYEQEELVNSLVSEDGKSLALFVKHTDLLSKVKSDKLINDITDLNDQFEFEGIHIAGRTVGQKYYIDKMTFEMALFVGLGALLIIVFLAIAFRSIWGVIIPQIIIVSSVIWVVGGMGVFREPVNIVLSVLPSIMFVVAMSDVIHLVSRYLDALRDEPNVFKSIKTAVSEVGMATLLTSITTAIGFFSLIFVRVQPIQAFGVVMGFGVLIAFILTFLTLPILFYIFPGPRYVRKKSSNHFWKKFLERGFLIVTKRRKAVLVISSVVVLVSIIGTFNVKTNNFLMDDITPNESLKQDFNFLDDKFGGVRPFELAINLKDTAKTIWDLEVLQELDTVEGYLQDTYGVNINISVIQALKVINRASKIGDPNEFKIPSSKKKIRKYRKSLRLALEGDLILTMLDSTERYARVSGGIPDWGNEKVAAKNTALEKFLIEHDLDGTIDYQLTGTAHLVDKNLRYLSVSLIKGLAVSVLIVALIIGLIYRSTTILVISIITNLIPLLFIAGVMGYLGIDLKTSTSIIFTIAFGIAVDDTIHFLGKFKHELMKGNGKMYALKRSYLTTGKAMILTTLILCAGFILLILSTFLGTYYLGLLLCITLLVALIADLTLLPVLLLVFYKARKKD